MPILDRPNIIFDNAYVYTYNRYHDSFRIYDHVPIYGPHKSDGWAYNPDGKYGTAFNGVDLQRVTMAKDGEVFGRSGNYIVWLKEADEEKARECIAKGVREYVDKQIAKLNAQIDKLKEDYAEFL